MSKGLKLLVYALVAHCGYVSASHAEWRETYDFSTPIKSLETLQCNVRLKLTDIENWSTGPKHNSTAYFYPGHHVYLTGQDTSDGQPGYVYYFPLNERDGSRFVFMSDGFLDANDYGIINNHINSGATFYEIGIYASFSGKKAAELSLYYHGTLGGKQFSKSVKLKNSAFKTETDCSSIKMPGDADHSGCVDLQDVYVFYSNMLQRDKLTQNVFGATFEQGDFDSSGILDAKDINILAANYGRGCNK